VEIRRVTAYERGQGAFIKNQELDSEFERALDARMVAAGWRCEAGAKMYARDLSSLLILEASVGTRGSGADALAASAWIGVSCPRAHEALYSLDTPQGSVSVEVNLGIAAGDHEDLWLLVTEASIGAGVEKLVEKFEAGAAILGPPRSTIRGFVAALRIEPHPRADIANAIPVVLGLAGQKDLALRALREFTPSPRVDDYAKFSERVIRWLDGEPLPPSPLAGFHGSVYDLSLMGRRMARANDADGQTRKTLPDVMDRVAAHVDATKTMTRFALRVIRRRL
jgi:hypothetical protein